MSTADRTLVNAATLGGSPGSAESVEAANNNSSSAAGRATEFSGNSATPSSTATRDPRKDPIPAPTPATSSQPSSSASTAPQQTTSSPPTAGANGGAPKSMFDETPEEVQKKKDYLRALASGNKRAVEQFKQSHQDDEGSTSQQPHLTTATGEKIEMENEKWGDDKDPVYNSKAAAKEDYYEPAKTEKEEEEEDVTVACTKLLMTDPATIAKVAKESAAK